MFLFDLSEFGGLMGGDVGNGLVDEPHELDAPVLERGETGSDLAKLLLIFFWLANFRILD